MLPHRQPSVSSEYKDRYDRLIPKDHFLRKLFDLVDISCIYVDISCIYDELVEVTIGHESPIPYVMGGETGFVERLPLIISRLPSGLSDF